MRYDDLAPEFTVGETDAITFVIGSPSGTEVYNAEATDGGDSDDGITYSLGDANDEGEFTIDSDTGSVTYRTNPDSVVTHTIIITATDKGGNPDTITVTITTVTRPDGDVGQCAGWLLQLRRQPVARRHLLRISRGHRHAATGIEYRQRQRHCLLLRR